MIDFDNEYFQYQNGYLDDKFFEGQFKRRLIRNAKRWRRLDIYELRPELRDLVDELLAEKGTE